jgi:hypothetical protein
MDTHEAMQDLFATYTNSQLQEMTAENYYTIASWRFKFNCNQLSMEKQISILTKLNYQPTQNLIMEKTSKVTNVAGIGTWNGQYGVMYKFEVSFENGDSAVST